MKPAKAALLLYGPGLYIHRPAVSECTETVGSETSFAARFLIENGKARLGLSHRFFYNLERNKYHLT
jgi:hypothetical protein